ncbi:23S rRNA pseudouridine(1911/1915/1917) synthase RluD [Methylomagnum ishizawai]|uniref:23S rRNA pseudouridine(1911/1915/1917) synthase RluD n=1 Tax=Methylomagnum ishizawai TaxID=1760988 RepID=UPI001C3411E9|nr:23S rRNA pseudouridine(1911/1915/1917) synthase RluD [Methylomagnum ishizawai]BBL76558.1 ribosomal large subunit pseudouridine synthase D [Methylomagnum ishizawai]
MNPLQVLTAEIPVALAGLRLDQALSEVFPGFSRGRLQTWIKSGAAKVDGAVLPPKHRILGGEHVVLQAEVEPATAVVGQDIPLEIVHEDDDILIIDKPAGLVVHPAAGHSDGTLQNALLHHAPELAGIPRCGIVHRIDKDTSGLLMVAKTLTAHNALVEQLQEHSVQREYLALAQGAMTAGGTVDAPIGRHPRDRKRYAVRNDGKPAVTHYRVAERFPRHTLLRVRLETGRTHQIRVHMSHIDYPLVGDPVYGGRPRLPPGAGPHLVACLREFRRQALHAETLGIVHPATGDYCEWQSPLPDDFAGLLDALRAG